MFSKPDSQEMELKVDVSHFTQTKLMTTSTIHSSGIRIALPFLPGPEHGYLCIQIADHFSAGCQYFLSRLDHGGKARITDSKEYGSHTLHTR